MNSQHITIIGLGYAGRPLAFEFGTQLPVTDFDIKPLYITDLRAGRGSTLEIAPEVLKQATHLRLTAAP